MRLTAVFIAALTAALVPREAAAQLDPLLFLKRTQPNVLLAVDLSNRMLRDANNDYIDANVYSKSSLAPTDQLLLGIDVTNTTTYYRRRYVGLAHASPGNEDKFTATKIDIVGDLESGYATFDEQTRLAIARRALREAVNRNLSIARFGLLKMRQSSPAFSTAVNSGPVKLDDAVQKMPSPGDSSNKWYITRPTVTAATDNGEVTVGENLTCSTTAAACRVAADASNASSSVASMLDFSSTRGASDLTTFLGHLVPGGNDVKDFTDAPIDLMMDDIATEAARLATLDVAEKQCRNTVAVLVVGGAQGNSSSGNPGTQALKLLNIGSNHRVPVHVIAIAPVASDDMSSVQAVATNSGGTYTVITAEQIAATAAGQPVPELVRAVNNAVQHAFTKQSDCDTDPTGTLPLGPYTEHQVTSPIVGTIYLKGAKDMAGNGLDDSTTSWDETYIATGSTEIPQRSNVLLTTGFSLPGFDGKLRAFRVYRPVEDSSKPMGYRFTADGRRLWVACAPGTATSGVTSTPCTSMATSQRNIYTALPDGTVVAFNSAKASDLRTYLRASTDDEAADIIEFIRSQPLGAFVGSTPAIMDPPSLDPPPDSIYNAFKTENQERRSMVWVGGNDGMLHAIDGRLGVEVWAFIPFNLLPKLHTLRSGQPVGDFRYFVDSSPKIAEVKVGDDWRTYLIVGQGAGGTFYQTFDVTLDDMDSTVSRVSDTVTEVLDYFDTADSVPLVWAFPRYSSFDTTLGSYGELASTASAVEKTVGETWSDPAVGQIESSDGPYAVLTGSGFLKYSTQTAYRGGVVAGTTFYVLNIADGQVLASRSIGSDGQAETVDDCSATGVDNCTRIKNALQADPVATGPSDSRFITKAYIGDLDGDIWRFDMSLAGEGGVQFPTSITKVWDGSPAHPLFTSMATVNVGTTQQYLFQGTGSEFLPSDGVSQSYELLVILDNGTSGTKKATIALEKTDSLEGDEKVTAFPAVAGDIVFFATTTYKPTTPCPEPTGNLYAFTFLGGPAYDTNGDGTVTSGSKKGSADSTKIRSGSGRATAPFIVDQHLTSGIGGNIEMFGDENDFNNGVGQVGVRILSWREVR